MLQISRVFTKVSHWAQRPWGGVKGRGRGIVWLRAGEERGKKRGRERKEGEVEVVKVGKLFYRSLRGFITQN